MCVCEVGELQRLLLKCVIKQSRVCVYVCIWTILIRECVSWSVCVPDALCQVWTCLCNEDKMLFLANFPTQCSGLCLLQ